MPANVWARAAPVSPTAGEGGISQDSQPSARDINHGSGRARSIRHGMAVTYLRELVQHPNTVGFDLYRIYNSLTIRRNATKIIFFSLELDITKRDNLSCQKDI